jgi:hypothetical protein
LSGHGADGFHFFIIFRTFPLAGPFYRVFFVYDPWDLRGPRPGEVQRRRSQAARAGRDDAAPAFGVRWQAKHDTALARAAAGVPGRPRRPKSRLGGTLRCAGALQTLRESRRHQAFGFQPCRLCFFHKQEVIAQLGRLGKCSIGCIGCIGSFPLSSIFLGASSRLRPAGSRLHCYRPDRRAWTLSPRGGGEGRFCQGVVPVGLERGGPGGAPPGAIRRSSQSRRVCGGRRGVPDQIPKRC